MRAAGDKSSLTLKGRSEKSQDKSKLLTDPPLAIAGVSEMEDSEDGA